MPSTSKQMIETPAPAKTRQVRNREEIFADIMQFLTEEASLLDERKFEDWLKLFAADFSSVIPVRTSVHIDIGAGFDPSMVWAREDLGSLTFKAKRLGTDSAFNEDPPSRTRRLLTNLRVFETSTPGEYLAQTYFLVRRNRGDAHESESLSGKRDDLLRRDGDSWKVARRIVWIDQAVLGMQNLAIFL